MVRNRFFKFTLFGGIAAAVNFGSRFFYNAYASFIVAVLLAYVTGMITAFVLNRLFVFHDSTQSIGKQFFYFTLVNLLAIVQTVIISVGLAEYVFPWIGWHLYRESIAHFIGITVPIITSFLGHKKYSFAITDSVEKEIPLPFEQHSWDMTDKIILLDIDGTLVADNTLDITDSVRQIVRNITIRNKVFLCTNSKNRERNRKIAQILAVPLLETGKKKPNPSILKNLPFYQPDSSIVIGDKFLTDELFACFTKTTFIRVARKYSGQERWKIKLLYWIDDVLYTISRPFLS